MEIFEIRGEFIELNKLFKALSWVQSGGEAKMVIQDEQVIRNGEIETRVRAKLVAGDVIEWNGNSVTLKKIGD